MVKNNLIYFLSLLLVVEFILLNSSYTSADIFAERNIANNKLAAISIDIKLLNTTNNNQTSLLFNTSDFEYGGFDVKSIRVKNPSDLDFNYLITGSVKIEKEEFCKNLKIKIYDNKFILKQEASILDLNTKSFIKQKNTEDLVIFLTLENNTSADTQKIGYCEFAINFKSDLSNSKISASREIVNTVFMGAAE